MCITLIHIYQSYLLHVRSAYIFIQAIAWGNIQEIASKVRIRHFWHFRFVQFVHCGIQNSESSDFIGYNYHVPQPVLYDVWYYYLCIETFEFRSVFIKHIEANNQHIYVWCVSWINGEGDFRIHISKISVHFICVVLLPPRWCRQLMTLGCYTVYNWHCCTNWTPVQHIVMKYTVTTYTHV